MEMRERIKRYIESNGMRLNFVANKSGIKVKRFYRLIDGSAPLTVEEYEVICKGLSISPEYFFRDFFLDFKSSELSNEEVC